MVFIVCIFLVINWQSLTALNLLTRQAFSISSLSLLQLQDFFLFLKSFLCGNKIPWLLICHCSVFLGVVFFLKIKYI